MHEVCAIAAKLCTFRAGKVWLSSTLPVRPFVTASLNSGGHAAKFIKAIFQSYRNTVSYGIFLFCSFVRLLIRDLDDRLHEVVAIHGQARSASG